MPGATPNGYPYAEPTDPLVQWPATSQQLAEKLNTLPRIVFGMVDVTTDADGVFRIPHGLGAIPSTFGFSIAIGAPVDVVYSVYTGRDTYNPDPTNITGLVMVTDASGAAGPFSGTVRISWWAGV